MKNKFYITTSIVYANANPHVGFAYEVFIADVLARHHRLHGVETYFATGMDEHGMKIARTAQANNTSTQEFIDGVAESFKELDTMLDISYDFFVRTSDKNLHQKGVYVLWNKFVEKGDIYKKKYLGFYCVGCEKFITEKELVDGKCPIHEKIPEWVEEENYFFKLSRYTDIIKNKIESGEFKITPRGAEQEIRALLEEGLEDVSFSRREDAVLWGIPVPNDPDQLMYVWCDALSNYITALGYGTDHDENFKKFWPAQVHLIGKDILRFHAAYWPAMLLSAGIPLPQEILVHGFITSQGKKMSKSLGNVIDPKEYIREFGVEAVRYFFARELSPFDDSDFTRERFIEAYNANLANGLGNLVSRTLKMTNTYFAGNLELQDDVSVPAKTRIGNISGLEKVEGWSIPYTVNHIFRPHYEDAMNAYEINKAADVAWNVIQELDHYITDYEPYKLIKENPEKTAQVLWSILYGLHGVTKMIAPLMPATSEKILDLLGATYDEHKNPIKFQTKELSTPLFVRIDVAK